MVIEYDSRTSPPDNGGIVDFTQANISPDAHLCAHRYRTDIEDAALAEEGQWAA